MLKNSENSGTEEIGLVNPHHWAAVDLATQERKSMILSVIVIIIL